MIEWLNEWWKETRRVWNDPNFIKRKGGLNKLPPIGERPPPPKGQGYPVITLKIEGDKND